MALFKIENNKVEKVKSVEIEKEKDIQKIFEENLETILDIHFLETEYSTNSGGRIDTLGIDNDGSPVIIEYKKIQSENIINQGLFYLEWLLDHKDSFEKLVSQKLDKSIELQISWDTPRVICIAENFNKFDLATVNIVPIKIELFTYAIYENHILQTERQNYQGARISMAKIVKNAKQETEKLPQYQTVYIVEEHLEKGSEETKSLFFKLRELITSIDENIKEEPQKLYIAYKLTTNFTDIVIYNDFLKIFLNIPSGKLNDPHNLARDLVKPKHIGHWGNGDYELKISKEEELNKVFELIKQSYNYNK